MSVEIYWDTKSPAEFAIQLEQGLKELVETHQVLSEIVGEILLPRIIARSMTVWNIRTGRYSSSWYNQLIAKDEIEIGNTAPYSYALEYGWEGRESPGVMTAVMADSLSEVRQVVLDWIERTLRP